MEHVFLRKYAYTVSIHCTKYISHMLNFLFNLAKSKPPALRKGPLVFQIRPRLNEGLLTFSRGSAIWSFVFSLRRGSPASE